MTKKTAVVDVEDGAVGSTMECYARVERLIYPKTSFDKMEYGQRGIVALYTEDVLKGKLPEEMNHSFIRDKIDGHFVATGRLPQLDFGRIYFFRGTLIEHDRYGLQYKIDEFHRVYELKEEETEIFVRAIFSDYLAEKLLTTFKDPLLPLKEKDIVSLIAIPGIGQTTAEKMIQTYEENFEKGTAYVQLAEYGLTPTMIDRMQKSLKSIDTILYVLQNDPYSLIDMVDGIGWEKADAIAANSGNFGPCDPKRVRAYIKYFLRECAEDYGHSWVDLDFLVTGIKTKIPNIVDADLQMMLRLWIKDTPTSKAWLYYEPETRRIGLNYYRQVEQRIARHLIRLQHTNAKVYSNEEINQGIAETEAELGFEYTDEQRAAIQLCLTEGVAVISGSAGTGKTTIMRAVTHILKGDNAAFAQCSLSGKASSNLTEVTGELGMTIHRLLAYNPATGQFNYNQTHPLPYNVIIVDELSLIGGELFLQLIEAIRNGSKLICLGDEKQLESIGMANLLKDCINSHYLPARRLIKIHRQAAKSGIITESLRASAGEQIVSHTPGVEVRGELQDFKIVSSTEPAPVADSFIEEYKKLFFEKRIPVQDIMGVVPMRIKGDVSCFVLNKKIQEFVNPNFIDPRTNEFTKAEMVVTKDKEEYILREGDKILVVQNCYDTVEYSAEREEYRENNPREHIDEPPIPIFNGNTGFIELINKKRGYLVIKLAQGAVKVPFSLLSSIELGYVLTCHKSQGSGVPYVICGLTMQAYALLSKEWIYTALTRAKKYCVLCTQITAARQAVTVSRVSIKHTWLQELISNYELQYREDKTFSIPDPEDKLSAYIGRSPELEEAFEKAAKIKEQENTVNE